MNGGFGAMFRWLADRGALPRWVVLILFLTTLFNAFMFVALAAVFWRPDSVPVPITGDVALGLHLQIFEAFLAALAIGLAVLGFVGYSALREAAERRAEEAAREVAQGFATADRMQSRPQVDPEPDLAGLDEDVQPGDRHPETGI